jgi:hypothetical protein
MESYDTQAADDFIRKLARGNGWVSEENRAKLQSVMPEALESLDGARKIACRSTEACVCHYY